MAGDGLAIELRGIVKRYGAVTALTGATLSIRDLELKQLQQETGVTFVFVTHDQEEALTMSDRIALMSAGEIRQVGTPFEI